VPHRTRAYRTQLFGRPARSLLQYVKAVAGPLEAGVDVPLLDAPDGSPTELDPDQMEDEDHGDGWTDAPTAGAPPHDVTPRWIARRSGKSVIVSHVPPVRLHQMPLSGLIEDQVASEARYGDWIARALEERFAPFFSAPPGHEAYYLPSVTLTEFLGPAEKARVSKLGHAGVECPWGEVLFLIDLFSDRRGAPLPVGQLGLLKLLSDLLEAGAPSDSRSLADRFNDDIRKNRPDWIGARFRALDPRDVRRLMSKLAGSAGSGRST
jgi:hypothetical protein